mmetsp:Transcript_16646/g.32559  ORF Transcript_16646/g.32559 Transcript_16646/m.32559 type:complete len:285 (+) Transcript_16646:280-1134(+)
MHSTLSENTLLAALQILNDDTEQIKSSACLRRCSSISLVSLLSFFAVYRLLGMLLMFISCSDRCQPDPNLLPEQNAVRTAGVIVLILGIIGVFGELPLAMLKGLSHEDCRLACRHVAALYHPYTFSKCALRSLLVDNAGVLVGNILGLLSGILCIVAGSLVVCCAPLNQTQGHDQYHAAGYCGLVAMGIDIGSMIWVFVLMVCLTLPCYCILLTALAPWVKQLCVTFFFQLRRFAKASGSDFNDLLFLRRAAFANCCRRFCFFRKKSSAMRCTRFGCSPCMQLS